MSEYETIKSELSDVKKLLHKLLQKEPPKKEWVSDIEACEMLSIKKSTLNKYRYERQIEFRSPRPFLYSVKSIEALIKKRTIRAI